MPQPVNVHARNVTVHVNTNGGATVQTGGAASARPMQPPGGRIGGGGVSMLAGPPPQRPPLQAAGGGRGPDGPNGPNVAGGGQEPPRDPPITNHMQAAGNTALQQMEQAEVLQSQIQAKSMEFQAAAAARAAQGQVIRDMNQAIKDAAKDQGEAGKKPS